MPDTPPELSATNRKMLLGLIDQEHELYNKRKQWRSAYQVHKRRVDALNKVLQVVEYYEKENRDAG